MNKKSQRRIQVKRKQKATRNYGIGSRNLLRAGRIFSHQSTKAFSTRGTLADRWKVFTEWLKHEHSISKMENITAKHVVQYGLHLRIRVEKGDLQSSTAQLYISAINSILKMATCGEWRSISPTKDCGIPQRKHLPEQSKAMPIVKHDRIIAMIDDRIGTLLNLQRTLGLRFKESCLLDAKKALSQADTIGYITVTSGTKGGKQRKIPINEAAKKALEHAAEIQNGRSLVPKTMTYAEFREECYTTAQGHDFNFHAERHYYAQQRYEELSGIPAPISMGIRQKDWLEFVAEFLGVDISTAEAIDHKARSILSRELGHNRLEVVRVYIG
jgi:site-specific recombinase XerC